ncbi:hypothetical protein ACSQ76_19785 [Roseovarius sp. B08]|uniref:hypothetical protein n=1 Tax=Roseovarius sp. B08 TaxID=3449223 RepID=UPI003EDB6C52
MIELAKKNSQNGYLFPNSTGGPLNKMGMRNFLVDNNIPARLQGFRSSLRTWLMDEIHCEEEIAEACIGHVRTDD